MINKTLEIKAAHQMSKPVNEVFDAIIDPVKMSNYFISKSSGKMEEGKNIIWQFPEFDMKFPVRVGKIEKTTSKKTYLGSNNKWNQILRCSAPMIRCLKCISTNILYFYNET